MCAFFTPPVSEGIFRADVIANCLIDLISRLKDENTYIYIFSV